nr:hypothetical protein BaRGS_022342 [Batillaria attramentaria]
MRDIQVTVIMVKPAAMVGEVIPLCADNVNNSDKDIKSTYAYVKQTVTFLTRAAQKSQRSTVIQRVKRGVIFPGGSMRWDGRDERLRVPWDALPSGMPGCSIIDVNYELVFVVQPKGFAKNMKLRLPLVVGGVPVPRDVQQEIDSNMRQLITNRARGAVLLALLSQVM